MTLPNYFMADLPPEATLSADMLQEACRTLRRNRLHYLQKRSTQAMIETISKLAREWLNPEFQFRKILLSRSDLSGFPARTMEKGIDRFFSKITRENLLALLEQDLGHPNKLDQFQMDFSPGKNSRRSFARAPELMFHFTAGNIPDPALFTVILGLLLRSAQFIKCASGGSFALRMFAHSLYEAEPKLASCIEIAEWKGGNLALEETVMAEADLVTATGSDETLHSIEQRIQPSSRFLGYGHRLSFGYIAAESLGTETIAELMPRVVDDIVAWNQLGCLSPHLFYIEAGGEISAERFAEMLADALGKREEIEPRGTIALEESSAIAYRRNFYEIRSASNPGTRLWQSTSSTAWTVVFEDLSQFQTSSLNRFVYIKPVPDINRALEAADSYRGKVSTVGLEAPDEKLQACASTLSAWGVTRICPVGKMQNPSLLWRHDGRPALQDLVTWCDWEQV